MTSDVPPEDELSPEQTERVRRLLSEARHTEPMPAEVAARIDRALADLPAGRPADVVPLEQRRRTAGRLLLAAAAVVVVGVGVGQVVSGSGDPFAGNDSSAQSEGLAAPDRDESQEVAPDAVSPQSGDAGAELSGPTYARVAPQRIRSDRFAADARAVRRDLRGAFQTNAPRDAQRDAEDAVGCAAGRWGAGRYVPVSFDGEPGWLVYRPARGQTQVADLFLCGTGSAERSTTLPRQ